MAISTLEFCIFFASKLAIFIALHGRQFHWPYLTIYAKKLIIMGLKFLQQSCNYVVNVNDQLLHIYLQVFRIAPNSSSRIVSIFRFWIRGRALPNIRCRCWKCGQSWFFFPKLRNESQNALKLKRNLYQIFIFRRMTELKRIEK